MSTKIKLKEEYDCERTIKEFEELIGKMLAIKCKYINKEGIEGEEDQKNFSNFLNILFGLLEERTNVNELEHNKDNYSLSIADVKGAVWKKEKGKLFETFLNNLNENIQSKKPFEFTYIVALNLKFEEEYKNDLSPILSFFRLELCDPKSLGGLKPKEKSLNGINRVIVTGEEALEVLESHKNFQSVFKVNVKARNKLYASKKVKLRVESFLGYILYKKSLAPDYLTISNISTPNTKFGELDCNLSNLKYDVFLQLQDSEIIWPSYDGKLEDVLKKMDFKENKDSKENTIDKWTVKMMVEDGINKIDTLKKLLYNSLALYYSASTEPRLDYSFLKFWSLSENIIKKVSGKTNDPDVLEIMKNSIKLVDEHLPDRIGFLQDKRNKLVHKGETGRIYLADRNLAKLLADNLIKIVMTKMVEGLSQKKFKRYLLNLGSNDKM